MVALFMLSRWELMAALGLFLLLLGRWSGLRLSYLLRGLRPIGFLIALTLLFNGLFTPGRSLEGLPWFTHEGLLRGFFMAVRLVFLVFLTSLLTLTTSPVTLADGVERLLTPFSRLGMPAHEWAMVATIALRFVPTLALEAERIMKAQLARGANLDRGGLLARGQAMVPVLVPLFVRAFRHAEDLALAMESRCYGLLPTRSRVRQLRIERRDVLFLAGCSLFLVGLVIVGRLA